MAWNTIVVDGIRMRWEEHGRGPAVVFLHGIPTNPRLWRHVVARLPGARALAWELVGYGDSAEEGRGRDISVARQADYLAAWLRTLGQRGILLVGHDLGGGVAQICAVRHRDLVAGLVLMNAVCYGSWPIPEVIALRAASPVLERLPDRTLAAPLGMLMGAGHTSLASAREAFAVHAPPYLRDGGMAAFVRQIRSLDARDTEAVTPALPSLGLPARLVWGAADPFQPINYGRRLARDLGAPLDAVAGVKHFVPEDAPDRVAAAVQDVLGRLA